jgi:DNA modification methylase
MELYNDDCFNVFPLIKDKSVDLFVLDLPYANKKFGNCTACKWDTPIDLKEMWKEIKRIMKPNATIVHFCNTKFGFALIESNPKWFRYDLIWKKSRKVGFLSANKMPLRQHENIYIFKDEQGTYNPQKTEGTPYNKKENIIHKDNKNLYNNGKLLKNTELENKGDRHPTSIIDIEPDHENIYVFKDKQGTYNPQKTEGKPYKTINKGVGYFREKKGDYSQTLTENNGDRFPISIIDDTILEYKNPHKTIHRTQKPVDLLEWLIKTYSNENDTVMDFCMGSGTTGVACKNLNRKFIGVEKDKEMYEKAKDRIEK